MHQTKTKEKKLRVLAPRPPEDYFLGGLRSLWRHRSLLLDFVRRDFNNRYFGGALGVIWTIATPLVELCIYSFVFHGLMGIRFHPEGGWGNYALFLFGGMVTWLAFSDGLSHAASSISHHSNLIKKVHFPLLLLPSHIVLSAVINQLLRVLVLVGAVLLIEGQISFFVLLVPFVMMVQALFTLGLSLLLCTFHVYFRDTQHWVNAVLLMWMFITPVFYPAASYPTKFTLLLQLNPLAHLVGIYRELLLNHSFPHPNSLIIVLVVSVLTFFFGYSVFSHHQRVFADHV